MYLGFDEAPLDAEVVSATYTASVGGGDGFSIGNACAAELSIVLADAGLVAGGQAVQVTWDAAGTEYPLFVGKVSKATVSGSQTTITAYDAMDSVSGTPYQPTITGSCTAAEALADIAAQIGVALDSDTQTLAAGTALTEGTAALEGLSLSNAAANIALLLGGNAIITRAGTLAVRQFTGCGWATESYSGEGRPEDTAYTVDGLTLQRTDTATTTNEDGTTTETDTSTDYTASAGTGVGLTYSSNLATQALVDSAYAVLSGLTFRAGSFSVQGGVFLEPGDLVTVDGLTVAVSSLTLSLDGGCKASITSLGAMDTTSTGGSITQAISAIQQDYGEFKSLVAQNVSVTNANITNLQAAAAQMETAIIGKAEVSDLTAVNANIDALTADLASLNSLLAGNIGTGTLETVHLTSENVVIDDAVITDAMIADLSAGKLTAGTIYTSLIRIANDTGENFLIDGATLQIKDANGTYRIQMGEDGDGNYSYYLWDADGNLIFDALGAYALHDSIIKDVNVAEDANINQSKIDMASVAERLNSDGSITVSASNVTIDDSTLDYKLTTMVSITAEAQAAADAAAEAAAALKSDAVSTLTQYYSVGDSAEAPPSAPEDGVVRAAALADTAIVGQSRADAADSGADWTSDYPTISDGQYFWTAFFIVYADGAEEWTTPTCLSDSAARESVSTLQTELAVVQGQIAARVWQTDIDAATDALNESITTLQDRYSAVTQAVGGITAEVADLTTEVSDNYTALQTEITTVSETAEGIRATVSDLSTTVTDQGTTITTLSSELTQLADSIALCVTTDADTGYLRLGAGEDGTVKFTVDTDNLTIDEDGNVSMAGKVAATSGQIGPWTISQYTLYTMATIDDITYQYYMQAATGDEDSRYSVFGVHDTTNGTWPYRVFYDGSLACSSLTCTGSGSFSGSLSTYGYTVPRMQHGSVSVSVTADTVTGFSVTFSKAFSGTPDVFLTVQHDSDVNSLYCKLRATTSTGFTGYIMSSGGGTHIVRWLAVYG
ncbi:MAG: H-type lectin domain-containing protein [Clostridiales bacterium]|nr:H-type lectin domain-containing protein [Clostridiales bacterium]